MTKPIEIVNATPHEVVICPCGGECGSETCTEMYINAFCQKAVLPASGILPRVEGQVVGLPEPVEGVVYLVSRGVFEATDRLDVVAPDTGTAIRKEGRIQAVTRLIRK